MKKSSPSIGRIGLTVDPVNRRTKILDDTIFSSFNDAVVALEAIIAASQKATKLLHAPKVRFTARVIGRNLGSFGTFTLPGGLIAHEEGRFYTSSGHDLIYLGANSPDRMDLNMLENERNLASAAMQWNPSSLLEPKGVTYKRLTYPVSDEHVRQLVRIYKTCFPTYLVPLNAALIQSAAQNSILIVAFNQDGQIIASTIGESLQVGPLTLLEVSEQVICPILRIKGAASGCARRVIEEARRTLPGPVVAFWEARMWRNVLGMSKAIGLTEFGGILHQHCIISSSPEFTSIPQTEFGSLAIFYSPE